VTPGPPTKKASAPTFIQVATPPGAIVRLASAPVPMSLADTPAPRAMVMLPEFELTTVPIASASIGVVPLGLKVSVAVVPPEKTIFLPLSESARVIDPETVRLVGRLRYPIRLPSSFGAVDE
jgi:hypothetical protein